MSRENVELVIRALSAVAERPRPDFETVNELFHPDHVLLSIASNRLGEAERTGARGFQAWLEEQERVMPFHLTVEGAVDVADDVVLAVVAVHFQGASSGFEAEQRTWNVVTVRESKIARTESYLAPAEALRAVGLRE